MLHFLITNDDGFDAPGLVALYRALQPLGQVTVVAPAECHSSRGHAVDTKNAIRLTSHDSPEMGRIHVVHSSPADCIRVALGHLLPEPPDIVVAGINPGANLGVDLFYSGTAAAAREATIMGVPSIAVSRLFVGNAEIDWETLGREVTRVVQLLISAEYQLPERHFWNVNFPAPVNGSYPDSVTFAPQGVLPHSVRFEVRESDGEGQLLHYSGAYRDRGVQEDCDSKSVFAGCLTATPTGPSLTSGRDDLIHTQTSLPSVSCAD